MGSLMNRNQVDYTPEEIQKAREEAQSLPTLTEDAILSVLNKAAWAWMICSVLGGIVVWVQLQSPIYGLATMLQGAAGCAFMLVFVIVARRLGTIIDLLKFKAKN